MATRSRTVHIYEGMNINLVRVKIKLNILK